MSAIAYVTDKGDQRIIIGGVDYLLSEAVRRLAAYDDYAAVLGALFGVKRLPEEHAPFRAHAAVQALLADYATVRAALAQLYAECDPTRKEWYLMISSAGMDAAKAALDATKGGER